jgi:DNA-directed RNA polymerase subunit N
MIVPVRCITCGKPVGHLWEAYQQGIKKGRNAKNLLDNLGLERYCCRALFLAHVDITEKIGKFV